VGARDGALTLAVTPVAAAPPAPAAPPEPVG
jgi:hypothetical protein